MKPGVPSRTQVVQNNRRDYRRQKVEARSTREPCVRLEVRYELDRQSRDGQTINQRLESVAPRSRIAAALVLVVYAFQPALAQHVDVACKGVSVTSELVECLETALKASDSKLNETYGRVQSVLAPRKDDLKNLGDAERAWIHFRDLTCDAEYRLYGGGSGGPPAKVACLEAQTRNRNSDLLTTYGWLLEKFDK